MSEHSWWFDNRWIRLLFIKFPISEIIKISFSNSSTPSGLCISVFISQHPIEISFKIKLPPNFRSTTSVNTWNFWVDWFPINTIWTFIKHQTNVSKSCEVIMVSNVTSGISSSVLNSILPSDFSKLAPGLFFGPLSCFTLIGHSPHCVWLESNWIRSGLEEHEMEGAV